MRVRRKLELTALRESWMMPDLIGIPVLAARAHDALGCMPWAMALIPTAQVGRHYMPQIFP
jgi:hypothetical protein